MLQDQNRCNLTFAKVAGCLGSLRVVACVAQQQESLLIRHWCCLFNLCTGTAGYAVGLLAVHTPVDWDCGHTGSCWSHGVRTSWSQPGDGQAPRRSVRPTAHMQWVQAG